MSEAKLRQLATEFDSAYQAWLAEEDLKLAKPLWRRAETLADNIVATPADTAGGALVKAPALDVLRGRRRRGHVTNGEVRRRGPGADDGARRLREQPAGRGGGPLRPFIFASAKQP